jgi:electron transfer flavoprotein alpha subunit
VVFTRIAPAYAEIIKALRIAVLIKQVPLVETLSLGPDGRLLRHGMDLEINAYCRRAISQGVELARQTGGRATVFTLGPPAAEDALREAVAWGADDGVLITDPAFAGSDTLATARALAAAIERHGPFDLILAGRNSVDADTGQVGPEVAELLDLPFLAGVRAMTLKSETVVARLELDDGWADAEVDLPALLTTAERLCPPAKVDRPGRAAVDPARLHRLTAADLGPGPWGEAGSPTRVGGVRALEVARRRLVLSGPPPDQVAEAVALLRDAGALDQLTGPHHPRPEGIVADGWLRGEKGVGVLLEPDRPGSARQLLGAAARLAEAVNGHVTAVAGPGTADLGAIGSWGADQLVVVTGGTAEEDLARAAAEWAEERRPWALLAPGTLWGREVAARLAARLGAGLTGDAVDLAVDGGRLLAWKPAFGGQLVAAITSSSAVQLATVRPGQLPTPRPRSSRLVPVAERTVAPRGRVRILGSGRDDDIDQLATAQVVVGVGAGVDPAEYAGLQPLLDVLGAELAATRKVTDQGWQPRSRQVGLTGRSLAPRLYVAVGLSGKFNHLVGVRGSGQILAINADPAAPVFGAADIGIVGDWHEVVPLLAARIAQDGEDEAST